MEEEKLKNDFEAVDTLSRYEEAKEDEKLSNKPVDLSDMVVKNVQHKPILLSDLPEDLIAEIFSRVHLTSLRSVRSTCKKWNVLSRNLVIGKLAQAKNQFLGFVIIDFRICALRIDLYDGDDLSVKQVSGLNQIEISKVYHCDGLLLCVLCDNPEFFVRLLVWNPYLGQKRWIFQDEQLAILYQSWENHRIMEIWVTNKIDYNEVLWTKWMKIDMNLVPGFYSDPFIDGGLFFKAAFGNIFIDEENKVAVVFGKTTSYQFRSFFENQTALIIGQDGSSKSINVRGTNVIGYFPSLVHIE